MADKFLEQFYESIILPRYKDAIIFGETTWLDHGKVSLDAWAHYFKSNGKEYALVYEIFLATPASTTACHTMSCALATM